MMNRVQENPYEVEKMLRSAERRFSELKNAGASLSALLDAEMDVNELRERANIAWKLEKNGKPA